MARAERTVCANALGVASVLRESRSPEDCASRNCLAPGPARSGLLVRDAPALRLPIGALRLPVRDAVVVGGVHSVVVAGTVGGPP